MRLKARRSRSRRKLPTLRRGTLSLSLKSRRRQSSAHLRTCIARSYGSMLVGACVFLVIFALAPDPGRDANSCGCDCEGERDPVAECAAVSRVAVPTSCAAAGLGRRLFVGVGHCVGSWVGVKSKVYSHRAVELRRLLCSMQVEVVHALRPVESSDAREGRQSLMCNGRTRRRIAAGRELALTWLEERGWGGGGCKRDRSPASLSTSLHEPEHWLLALTFRGTIIRRRYMFDALGGVIRHTALISGQISP
jgi:hypothetical protein